MRAEVDQPQSTGDGWNNVGRAGSGTQIDKDDTMLEGVDQIGGDSERQTRLARATGAYQREQADLRAEQQPTQVFHLALASNQGRRLRRQTAGNCHARYHHAAIVARVGPRQARAVRSSDWRRGLARIRAECLRLRQLRRHRVAFRGACSDGRAVGGDQATLTMPRLVA